jgi:hypothetical protein
VNELGASEYAGPVSATTSPGAPKLLRGNANNDSNIDISDPAYILNYLFIGGPAPPCDDVADANFDGKLDLSDAVYILRALFLGGDPILPEEARCD